jgi:hypothetical protein
LSQGLAFRGHDESKESKNKGNFRELVKTLANQNDDIRKVVLENAPENLQWIYGDIQKELISCFAKLVLILPVATTSVERCFSAMNVVNKKLCNKMGDSVCGTHRC